MMTPEKIQNRIEKSIEAAKKIAVNFIYDNKFDDAHAEKLTELLSTNKYPELKTISLMRTEMTDKGIISIAKFLEENQTIERLNLQWNLNMTDIGLKAVGDMLIKNTTLKDVFLEKPSDVTSAGAIYLAEKIFERQKKNPDAKLNLAFDEGLPQGVAEAYRNRLAELGTTNITESIQIPFTL